MTARIDYEVVAFNQATNNLQVRYFSEDFPSGVNFSIELPKTNGHFPEGQALESLIRSHVPYELLREGAMHPDVAPIESMPLVPKTSTLMVFATGTKFIPAGDEALFLQRPLVRVNGIRIPINVV